MANWEGPKHIRSTEESASVSIVEPSEEVINAGKGRRN